MTKSNLVVVKVGTSTLMTSDHRVNLTNMGALVEAVTRLKYQGYQVVLVTSGAVGFGCIKLGLATRPKILSLKQACAAAGQSQLIRMYEDLFSVCGVKVAQVLLCRSDFASRDRFFNFRAALQELLNMGVVPIINENDTVSVAEIRFGDNDTLSALVAVSLAANHLFLLTDVDCLYTDNPRTNPEATPVPRVTSSQLAQLSVGNDAGGQWGTGGMATKIVAARTAVSAGIETVLVNGSFPQRVCDFLSGSATCTVFERDAAARIALSTMTDQRRWLIALPSRGTIWIDSGACKAIGKKKSLLAAGIKQVDGSFLADECVIISAVGGGEVARALVTMNSDDIKKIMGKSSHEYYETLGFNPEPEIAYRSDIILTSTAADHATSAFD